MRYVRVGASGLRVSRIGLGMMSYGDPADEKWFLDEEAAEPIVRRAVEAGVTYFDTADMYSNGQSEVVTGRLLRRLFRSRDDYVLATKVYFPMGDGPNDRGLSRQHIMAAVDASLRRLGTDHIDLYQIHRWDSGTPVEETMRALDDLVRAGKVRYLGASLMHAWRFAKAQHVAERHGWTPFVSMQTRYHLAFREEEHEVIPCCADQGVGVLPYSPLARGLLAGNRDRGAAHTVRAGVDIEHGARARDDNDYEVLDALRTVAGARGEPPARIALAWLLHQPAVVAPIVGATKVAHLDDAVAATDLTLDEAERAALEAPYRPHVPYGY